MTLREAPPIFADVAFRAGSDGTPIFEGYAAVFDRPSSPITDQFGVEYVETVAPGTFKRSLNSGRRHSFVVDHNDRLLISTTNAGRLRLGEDSKGLHVESPWPNTDYANNVRALYDAGERLAMSFTARWTTKGHQWDAMRKNHRVTDAVLGHVTVLATHAPAFPDTTASFRALAERTEADVDDVEALVEALRSGRELDEAERNLLTRLAAELAPKAGEATEARSQDEPQDPKRSVAYWLERFPVLPEPTS